MKRSGILAVPIALTLTAGALAGVKVGDRAPPVDAGSWYNLPKGIKSLTPAHLKGQVIMVEFRATW